MMRSIWALALVGTLAACNPDTAGDATDPAATAAPSPTPTETETVESSGARSVAEETDDFLFEYSYPAEAGRIVELASLLDVDLAEQREDLAADAAAARRAARDEGFPYNKFSYSAEWKVVSDLPGWLSMSAEVATYTGGAHGNQTIRSLVWDKEAERSVDAIALFTSPAALGEALGDRFCDRLDQERAKRCGAPVPEDSDDEFDQCPDISKLKVLVGSSNRRTFDRLTLYAGPYVAGPYAEGAYEVSLPIDDAVLAVVKPEYREAFSARN